MSAAAPGTSKAAHGDVAGKKKKGSGALATAYLVIYNVVMTAGYVACFLVLMLSVCTHACVQYITNNDMQYHLFLNY